MATPPAGRTGTDTKPNHDQDVRPFRVHVPQAALDDLHARLRRTRYPRPAPGDSWDYGTPVEHLAGLVAYWRDGFAAANGSRPQTVAAGLSDSPVGQLAWSELFENFGSGTSRLTRDQVLTQVSLYWLTNTSATAARFYYEEARAGAAPVVSSGRTGVAVFADDFQTIRPFAERDNTNLVHWTEHAGGGHFAAMEAPEVVAADMREFFAGPSRSQRVL